jgi:hypothetical protein
MTPMVSWAHLCLYLSGAPLPSSVGGASAFTFCGPFSGQVSAEAQTSTSKRRFRISLDRQATLSWFVFTLKIKIKGTFALLLYWRFLFFTSTPQDTCVMV